MKSLLCFGLAAAMFVPPPPPPPESELPPVDDEGDEVAAPGDGESPVDDAPEVVDDEPTTNEFGVSAAALEPAKRPESKSGAYDAADDPAARGNSEANSTYVAGNAKDLDLDPYDRDDRPRYTNPGRGLQITGLTINAIGAAVGIGALVFVGRGAKARNALDDAKASGNASKRTDAIERIEASDRNAIILGATAGGLLVIGTVIYYAGVKKKRDAYARTTVTPALTRGGGGLVLRGQF